MRAARWSLLLVVVTLLAACSSGTTELVSTEPPPATELPAPAPIASEPPAAAAAATAPVAAPVGLAESPAAPAAEPTVEDDPVLEGITRRPSGPRIANPAGGAGTVQVANHKGGKPTPTGRIEIPAIGVNHLTYEGIDLAILDHGPSHWPGTALPGERGNTVFPGHRTTHSRPFWDLDKLVPGNEVIFTTPAGRFTYKVSRTIIVAANETSVVNPTSTPTFTIMACHPKGSARQRIVVKGDLVSAPPPPPPPPAGAARPAPAPRKPILGIL